MKLYEIIRLLKAFCIFAASINNLFAMKRQLIVFICVLIAGLDVSASAKVTVKKNQFGQELVYANGEQRNFSQAEIAALVAQNASTRKTASLRSQQQSTFVESTIKNPMNPKMDLLYTLMGTSIGRNSMHSVDIDSDGRLEIICTAATSTFGNGNYWYVLKQDTVLNSWYTSWASKTGAGTILVLEVADYDLNGSLDILLGYDDGRLEFYHAATLQLQKTIKPSLESIQSIVVADADNDGVAEIVLGCSNSTLLLNTSSLTVDHRIPIGSNVVRVGQLESNGLNEIAMSNGKVYLVKDSIQTLVWTFNSSGGYQMELSDIDGDNMKEIILTQSWQMINVYDVDTKALKYTLTTSLDINSLLMVDVNGDGKEEIIYGDGQWGSVHCCDATSKAKLWSVKNPEHGVAALDFADVNNDGQKELLFSAGWTSTGSDYLYIHSIKDNKLLWRSDDIGGPFYALATGDVDDDGKDEIVATSYESESGYDSGILFIFDAVSNRLKWKSDGNFFRNAWEGVFTAAISDIDNDGTNEIIVATDQLYDGQIWIVNGKTHTVESSHTFDLGAFHSLDVADVDNDGQKEIVTTDNSKLYIINPITWAVKGSVGLTYSYGTPPVVRCADVNGDGFKEVILCSNKLSMINGRDFTNWSTTASNYTCMDVFDWNNDGILDVMVGSSNGRVQVYDGVTKSILADMQPETTSITAVRGFRSGRNSCLIYSCNGAINVYQNASNCSISSSLGTNVGSVESLKLYNQKPNSTELLIGSTTSIWRMYLNFLTLSVDSLTLSADASSTTSFRVSTSVDWAISGCPDWLSMTNSSGSGEATVNLTATRNLSVSKRTASLVVAGQNTIPYTVTVIQYGVPPVLQIGQDSLKLGASALLSKKLGINSNVNWTVSIDQYWLNASMLSGFGNDSLTLTAQVNQTLVSREAWVTFTGPNSLMRKVRVLQEAGKPMLVINVSNLLASYTAGSAVSFNVLSNVAWSISCDQSWIRLNKINGLGNSSIRITTDENPYIYERSAIITVTGAGLDPQTVEVVQRQAPPVLRGDLNLSKISFANEAESFQVISNVSWRIVNNQDWLRISIDTGSTNAKIVMTAVPNLTGEIRAATLLLLSDDMEPFIVNVLQEETIDMTAKDLTSIQLYSMDFSNNLTLKSLMYNATISIYDINGKLVLTRKCLDTSECIDISSCPKGIYTIIYQDGKKVKSSKFIKR